MRIEHGGVVDVLSLPRECSFDGQSLDIDVGLHQCRQVRWQFADLCRLESGSIDEYRHFHTTIGRQITDRPVIRHIAVHHRRHPCFHGVDDRGGILVGWSDRERLVAFERRSHRLPFGELVFAPARIFIERDVELLDQVVAPLLDEPGRVFREVFARFSHEIAEALEHFEANAVVVRHATVGDDLLDGGVEIVIAPFEVQIERHVVDAGALVGDVLVRNVDHLGELLRRALHAVTEADRADRAGAADRPAIHRHRIDVLQEDRIRTMLLHQPAVFEKHRNRAKSAHDAADAEGIADRLAESVLLRNLEVDHC